MFSVFISRPLFRRAGGAGRQIGRARKAKGKNNVKKHFSDYGWGQWGERVDKARAG